MPSNKERDSAFKKFIKENKSLAFLLPLLGVLIIVLIIIYSGALKKDTSASNVIETPSNTPGVSDATPDASQPRIDVLPQIIRSDNEAKTGDEKIKDPFQAPMKLKGIIYAEEKSAAILEWGDLTYILKVNDQIGDSSWKVFEINKQSITIKSDEQTMVLELADRSYTTQK